MEIKYAPPGPTLRRFMRSKAFVRGIMGPIGGGKSAACTMELMRRAAEQKPDANGIRPTRFVITRNTYPQLKTTTINTFFDWVPRGIGHWREHGPPAFHITPHDGCTLDIEVIFLALDRPDDVKDVLSLEITGAWVNEAREVPKAIIDALTGRVGRYPPKRRVAPTWAGIIMDTNGPDTDHWWYVLAENDSSTPEGAQMIRSLHEAEDALRAGGLLAPTQPLMEFFRQPGARTAKPENIANLRAGYYQYAMAGKADDWVKVYIDAEYGFVREGKPVYPEFIDSVHVGPCEYVKGWPVYVGLDFGLTPAATFRQRSPLGAWRVLDELVATDMGALNFARVLAPKIKEMVEPGDLAGIYGDPAGDARAQTDEVTVYEVLRANGITAQPAPSNDFVLRREAIAQSLGRMIDGKPGFMLDPRCRVLRKGMAGAYSYKRMRIGGLDKFQDKPDKNVYSHVCDADQYGALGAGEGTELVRPQMPMRPMAPAPPYDPLSDRALGFTSETTEERRDPFDW